MARNAGAPPREERAEPSRAEIEQGRRQMRCTASRFGPLKAPFHPSPEPFDPHSWHHRATV
jgi:hypothetical protein